MTVICYKDGVLAADTAVWTDNQLSGYIHKIRRMRDGFLVGCAGCASDGQRFFDYYETGGRLDRFEPKNDDFSAILVSPEGFVSWIDGEGFIANAGNDCFAEGIASDMAMGAMLAGASADEAVRICMKNHSFVGGAIDVLELEASVYA